MMLEPTQPLSIARNVVTAGRTSISIPFEEPRQAHRLADPEVGDTLLVVTALGPRAASSRPRTSSNSARSRPPTASWSSRSPTTSRPSCRPTRS